MQVLRSLSQPTLHSHHSLTDAASLFSIRGTATTEIYTLSLHDALPIFAHRPDAVEQHAVHLEGQLARDGRLEPDRKSTRLNSSHLGISYAVFCLKKKRPPSPYWSSLTWRGPVRHMACTTADRASRTQGV